MVELFHFWKNNSKKIGLRRAYMHQILSMQNLFVLVIFSISDFRLIKFKTLAHSHEKKRQLCKVSRMFFRMNLAIVNNYDQLHNCIIHRSIGTIDCASPFGKKIFQDAKKNFIIKLDLNRSRHSCIIFRIKKIICLCTE